MDKIFDKFLTKLNIRLHRLYGKIQSSIMAFGINKGYFVNFCIGLFALINLFYNENIFGIEFLKEDFYKKVPILFTILSTGLTMIYSIIKYLKTSNEYTIILDSYNKKEIIEKIKLSDKYLNNGYRIRTFHNGKTQEKFVMSDYINIMLLERSTININIIDYKFEIADEIKSFVPSIMRRTFLSDKVIFNGKLVRMASDLFLESTAINMQKTRYFEGQCTNEIVYKQIKSNHSIEEPFRGECLMLNKDNVLFDLEHSSCSNYIGASTLVVVNRKHILIGKQGEYSKANSGRYAPSGSGSVNYKDINKSTDFYSLIINAMEREFCEENNYKLNNNIKTIVLGYVRLLERGGKPDFFGISFLDLDSEVINNDKIKKEELGIAGNRLIIDIDINEGIGRTVLEFCRKNILDNKVSIQLMILAELIIKYESRILEILEKEN
ncbi:protein of unknown function [Acetoanaerobium sticklandii]|uniref:Nudix hydrolase domain-containing protein n=1 Tax=Acetoanaerobium sticklandii (strain ATCC 12662 / DSM 519 / JCM 1433 / CCUG 9281 / NCIMB 10654 / HF) TaxID=499177 RepID=E3PV35_ACESD|nr:hypothetical protein [Acetoanaerobium sticklandii]CBH20515.1 protein of unknown function [Acetoanaerobium sticklandii]